MVRIVPLGPVDPETVAEVAHSVRRRMTAKVEVVAPRRLHGDVVDAMARDSRPSDADSVTLGVSQADEGQVQLDPARGVGVIVLPFRRKALAAANALEIALSMLAAG